MQARSTVRATILAAVLGFGLIESFARAETPAEKGQAAVKKSLDYLASQQKEDGSWQRSEREPPAISALVMRGFVRDAGFGKTSDPVKKGAEYLLSIQKPDGGIHSGSLQNYNTAVAISALAALDDPRAKAAVEKGVEFLKKAQFVEQAGQGKDPQDGGWNYGGARGGLADLSNTAVALDALKEAGVKEDDPAYKKAVEFVTRMQNHSETNSSAWAGNDGGFIYNPGKDGEGSSSAGDYTDDQGKRRVRSYGAMTYAGLKSMLYAGLSKEDSRVRSAWTWVRSNWTLEENAGLSGNNAAAAKAGLFYYYFTLARALDAYNEPTFEDIPGKKTHDWRIELIDKLASIQKPDGSFVGDSAYMEDNPLIATSLATLALQDALNDLKEHPVK
jgi:squalene-hopene/tetraprenyl-beta-curcumene cyclase